MKIKTKTIVIAAVGAALYGVGGLPIFGIPIFSGTTLKPAIGILAVFAGLYGPVTGLLVGLIGHWITDMFAGWGVWVTWIIGSGIVGFTIGLFPYFSRRNLEKGIFGPKEVVIFIILGFLGNQIGYGISAVLDFLFFSEPLKKVILQQVLASTTNTVLLAVIGSFVFSRIAARNRKKENLEIEP